ncbi:hypothetical protein Cni_G01371 [Canna indica]|uniref:Uncharacterized protein n=1 Tax=Canna indica TaxID=4628 RepID=A0AAQ3Q0X5_9LILI|nr:hypothetical protein Cni_G01371 [Canna indica]
MAWWNKVVLNPVKRAWAAVAARVKAPRNGGGILKLHNDVQMCGYQDVQIMWEMVRRSEMELSNKPKKRKRLIWRLLAWSNRTEFRKCGNGDPMDPH